MCTKTNSNNYNFVLAKQKGDAKEQHSDCG